MKREFAIATAILLVFSAVSTPSADAYLMDSTVPQSGGCPALDRWNLSVSSPLDRQWSTSLPLTPQTILTVATGGTSAQLTEIEQGNRALVRIRPLSGVASHHVSVRAAAGTISR